MPSRIFLDKRDGSPNWYIYEYDEATGQCPRTSTRIRDDGTPEALAKAERALAKFILSRTSRQELPGLTVVQALLRYYELYGKTRFSAPVIRTLLKQVAEHIPTQLAETFEIQEQEAFLSALEVSPATQRRTLGIIAAACRFLKRRKEMSTVPEFAQIKVPKAAGVARLSIPQLRALFNATTSPRQELFLLLSLATLSRPCAVLDLEWSRVDLEHGLVDLQPPARERTKKHRPIVPLPPTLVRYLKDHTGTGLVIQWGGKRLYNHRMLYRRVSARAGVTTTAYGIRKAGASWLRQKGVPELDIKGMLGHSMTGCTETYAQYDPEYMKEARDAIEALLWAVAPKCLAPYVVSAPAGNPAKSAELVGGTGIEPVTPTMSMSCSTAELTALPGVLSPSHPLASPPGGALWDQVLRSREPNHVKVGVVVPFPQLRAANDD